MTKAKSKNTDSLSPLFGRGLVGGSYIEVEVSGPVARITLNRPERHNALILEMVEELDRALDTISGQNEIHFLVLSGNGRSFCAGADLNWFYSTEEMTVEQSAAQYKQLADVLLKLYQLPQITIAAVRGNVFGGGIGLMAACDFVLAETNSRFMFSEVKLGLLPATILPFVAKRISVQNQKKWILTGDLFIAAQALDAGLIDVLCGSNQLEVRVSDFIASFESASPSAVRKAKQMIRQVSSGEIGITDAEITSGILAEALHSPDGQEGVLAFLEKRKPEWSPSQTLPVYRDKFPEGEGLKRIE